MADLRFAFSRGGPGYEMDWEGEKVIIKALGAAKVGIAETMRYAVENAKANHPDYPPSGDVRFANRTRQMIDAITILEEPTIIWASSAGHVPRVRGEWGVEDQPVVQDPDMWSGRWPDMRPKFKFPVEGGPQEYADGTPISTMDRAIFLEFGTIRAHPRPFLYPAWDDAKILLPLFIKLAFQGMAGGRGHVGRFSFG